MLCHSVSPANTLLLGSRARHGRAAQRVVHGPLFWGAAALAKIGMFTKEQIRKHGEWTWMNHQNWGIQPSKDCISMPSEDSSIKWLGNWARKMETLPSKWGCQVSISKWLGWIHRCESRSTLSWSRTQTLWIHWVRVQFFTRNQPYSAVSPTLTISTRSVAMIVTQFWT